MLQLFRKPLWPGRPHLAVSNSRDGAFKKQQSNGWLIVEWNLVYFACDPLTKSQTAEPCVRQFTCHLKMWNQKMQHGSKKQKKVWSDPVSLPPSHTTLTSLCWWLAIQRAFLTQAFRSRQCWWPIVRLGRKILASRRNTAIMNMHNLHALMSADNQRWSSGDGGKNAGAVLSDRFV